MKKRSGTFVHIQWRSVSRSNKFAPYCNSATWQSICVSRDDGSTDKTIEILNEFSVKNGRANL